MIPESWRELKIILEHYEHNINTYNKEVMILLPKLSYDDASERCQGYNGILTNPQSYQDFDFISQLDSIWVNWYAEAIRPGGDDMLYNTFENNAMNKYICRANPKNPNDNDDDCYIYKITL